MIYGQTRKYASYLTKDCKTRLLGFIVVSENHKKISALQRSVRDMGLVKASKMYEFQKLKNKVVTAFLRAKVPLCIALGFLQGLGLSTDKSARNLSRGSPQGNVSKALRASGRASHTLKPVPAPSLYAVQQ